MASSYSTDLKLELMVTGENAGTWGDKTNTNLNLVQQAIAGVESITLTDGGTVALAMSDAALSNARNMVLKLATITLSSASNLTIPDGIEKFYILDATAVTNPTNLTFKTASGTGFTLDAAKIYAAYSNGTNIVEVSLDTLGGSIGTAQISDNAITAAKISNNAVTTDKILQSNVTTAKLAQNSVTANQITQSTITQTKLASNSVGPAQLQSTAVTAGDYTVASITVDEDGRLTAASSGSAGAQQYVLTDGSQVDGTFTFTANPATSKINVLMIGGGGGGGFRPSGYNNTGAAGGIGGCGYYSFAVSSHPYTAPFTVGAGGAMAHPSTAGGATTFGTPAVGVTGGNGGTWYLPPGSRPGSASSGTAPGAYIDLSTTTSNAAPSVADAQKRQIAAVQYAGGNINSGDTTIIVSGLGGIGSADTPPSGTVTTAYSGRDGAIFIYENILT
jgi:hypothetical protein